MEKFCVVANVEKDKAYETAEYIQGVIKAAGKQCVMANDRFMGERRDGYIDAKDIPEDVECLVILGGDGTMIHAARDFCHRKTPLLGVNLGTLGFLTEVERQNIGEALAEIFKGSYKIEHRMMLAGREEREGEDAYQGTALNDFVISKSRECRLITLHVYVNGHKMDTYVCDGIIISSSTGSTGYNLSAGGPVLTPEVKAMIITPICPHSLNKRSLVLPSSDTLTIEMGKSKEISDDYGIVNVDGSNVMELVTGERFQICRHEQEIQIIKLTKGSFYKRLRDKLNRGM